MNQEQSFQVKGNIVDIFRRSVSQGLVSVQNGNITAISLLSDTADESLPFILPGFVDAHVHIESSMLIPSAFARLAVVHGTVATVSDPHEIANVCGIEGVDFMVRNGSKVPFKFNFGAPSCVPATVFETAGATLDVAAVTALLQRPEIRYLSEMMNFPGVLFRDPEVMAKIEAAHALGKPVDGHAPGLMGEEARQYAAAGISTDHECFTAEEALCKLQLGMKILIREGSAARNFDALIPLAHEWFGQMMFCSDDKHPDSLAVGHIDALCARAVAAGVDVFNVLHMACINPVQHYRLPVGLLQAGDPADFILVNNLREFKVSGTCIGGTWVARNGQSFIEHVVDPEAAKVNRFHCDPVSAAAFGMPDTGKETIPVIHPLDGQLITLRKEEIPFRENGWLVQDTHRDLLKIAVVNRYHNAPVATAFICNTGLKKGAMASSVAHDSHNIVVVGCSDEAMARAVNLIVAARGGVSATDGTRDMVLPLPVGGLMSDDDGYDVAARYTEIDAFAKESLGSTLQAPFMTLSFMALLVIPHLKLSDKGLFDGDTFTFVA